MPSIFIKEVERPKTWEMAEKLVTNKVKGMKTIEIEFPLYMPGELVDAFGVEFYIASRRSSSNYWMTAYDRWEGYNVR